MGASDRIAEIIYRIATARSRFKVIITPIGIMFWLSLGALLILAALWLDRFWPVTFTSGPVSILLSVPWLLIGAGAVLWPVYRFFKAGGSPVPLNPPQELVMTGIYARVRNPMILGWVFLLLGLGLLLNSISLILVFTPLFLLINLWYLKNIEEKELEKKFGQRYVKYKQTVPMFIPKFGKGRRRSGE